MSADRRIAVIQVVVRFEVEGPHLTDGLALAGRIAMDAWELPHDREDVQERFVEAYGGTYSVKPTASVEVAAYPRHSGWMPEWTKPAAGATS